MGPDSGVHPSLCIPALVRSDGLQISQLAPVLRNPSLLLQAEPWDAPGSCLCHECSGPWLSGQGLAVSQGCEVPSAAPWHCRPQAPLHKLLHNENKSQDSICQKKNAPNLQM